MSEKRPVRLVEDEEEFEFEIEQTVIHHFRRLEGRLKTLEEAIALDREQAKGRKDVVGMLLWMEIEDLVADLGSIRIKA